MRVNLICLFCGGLVYFTLEAMIILRFVVQDSHRVTLGICRDDFVGNENV